MSAAWKYFIIETPASTLATCNICQQKVSRGGLKQGSFNTSNLIKHLKTNHVNEHKQFEAEATASKRKRDGPQQQTLVSSFRGKEQWDEKSLAARQMSEKITEMTVLCNLPIAFVESVGFRLFMAHAVPKYKVPSRKYITEKTIPALKDKVTEHVLRKLEQTRAISFSTDIWSSQVSPLSLLSFTAHWVDLHTFIPENVVLHANEFKGSHTGEAIAGAIESMLLNWSIPKSKVHAILRDNASNMKKAMRDLGVPSLGCFSHLIQLVVHDGLLSQRSVSDVLASGRKIIGHFKHSPLATSRLETVQTGLGMPVKRLIQDVPTRWNSTFYMTASLLEQKSAISLYSADHQLPATLTASDWTLLEKINTLLAPFEEITKQISFANSTASEVIPSVVVLKRLLAKQTPEDSGIKTMKATLLAAMDTRFQTVEEEPLYSVATILDPRYKDRYFTSAESSKLARSALIREVEKNEESPVQATTTEAADPASETPQMTAEPNTSSCFKGLYEELLQEHDAEQGGASSTAAQVQIETYLAEKTIHRTESPFEYWGMNKERLSSLATTAGKFLSAPSTSVDSERLFSTASNILDEKRNRLSGDHVETLIFLKKNLPMYLSLDPKED